MKIMQSLLMICILMASFQYSLKADHHIKNIKKYKYLMQLNSKATKELKKSPRTSLKYCEDGLEIINQKDEKLNRTGIHASLLFIKGKSLLNLKQFPGAVKSFKDALLIYQQLNHRDKVFETYRSLGDVNFKLTDSVSSILYYRKALNGFRQLRSTSKEAGATKSIGFVYYRLGKYDDALEYLNRALTLYRSSKNKPQTAEVLNNIGAVYYLTKDYNRAEQYNKEAYLIYREMNNFQGMGKYYNNTGNIYQNKKEYSNALASYRKSLKYKEKSGDLNSVAITLGNIGQIYSKRENRDLDESLRYHFKAYEIRKAIKAKWTIIYTLINIGNTYILKKDYKSALKYLNQSLRLAEQQKADSMIHRCLSVLQSCAEKRGDYKQALKYSIRASEIKEKVTDQKKRKQIELLKTHNQLEKKEQEIQLLKSREQASYSEIRKQNNLANLYIIISLLVTMIAIINFFLYRYKKRSEHLIKSNQKELQQINSNLKNMARTDTLTGLSNRIAILEKLHQEHFSLDRDSKGFTIMVASTTGLSDINSAYGYDTGDHILKSIALILKSHSAEPDNTARWTGDEFIIIFPETEPEEGENAASGVARAVEESPVQFKGKNFNISLKWGIAHCSRENSIEECISDAESHIILRDSP